MNKIFNDDCINVLPTIDTETVNLIITDCPYKLVGGGVTISKKDNECSGILGRRCVKKDELDASPNVRSGKLFTQNEITFSTWLPELFRVLKNNTHCYIMINSRNLRELQTEAEKVGFKFQNLLIWDKGNVTPNKYYMQGFECILMLRKGGARSINNMGSSNILRIPNIIGKKLHPTEKPIELINIMVENSSNENDVVLDPFMGCGSTILSCIDKKRKYIGIELDKTYFDIAQERINKQ